jgi:hypothetical protein
MWKLSPGAGFLLDDFDLPYRGKCGLTQDFLANRGVVAAARGYQLYYTL